MLRAHGFTVAIHRDHFPVDALDADFLPQVGRRGWVFLTKDKMIFHRQLELAALWKAKVRAFILRSGNLTAAEMADAFSKAIPAMDRLLQSRKGPFIARVTRTGAVELIEVEMNRRGRST